METRKPDWLKVKICSGPETNTVNRLLNKLSLHTVCQEGNCPNLMECFSKKNCYFYDIRQSMY